MITAELERRATVGSKQRLSSRCSQRGGDPAVSTTDALAFFRLLERRQRERNSVGIVLDAYSQRPGPNDW
jgi:hypothetical protein